MFVCFRDTARQLYQHIYYSSMEDTLSRARKGNEALHQLLKLLMNDRTELRPHKEENRTFFEEFKSNIEAIKKNHYTPEAKVTKNDKENSRIPKEDTTNDKITENETRAGRSKDMLLSKLERQSISIETLEAEIRKLRLQNQQLRETNYGLKERAEREREMRERLERESQKPVKAQSRPRESAAKVQFVPQADAAQIAKIHRQENTIDQLRTGLALVDERYEEAKRKWEASVAVSAFQERVILDLKAKLGQGSQQPSDLTEQLLNGCEIDSSDDRADTTQLILGRPSGSPYDHLGQGHSRFKAAALAVLFTVRARRAVQKARRERLI